MKDLSDMYLRNWPDLGNIWRCFDFFFAAEKRSVQETEKYNCRILP